MNRRINWQLDEFEDLTGVFTTLAGTECPDGWEETQPGVFVPTLSPCRFRTYGAEAGLPTVHCNVSGGQQKICVDDCRGCPLIEKPLTPEKRKQRVVEDLLLNPEFTQTDDLTDAEREELAHNEEMLRQSLFQFWPSCSTREIRRDVSVCCPKVVCTSSTCPLGGQVITVSDCKTCEFRLPDRPDTES